ncbi:helix-turn-helix transcriptional regulator [Pedobacter kyungheensis]|uniref:helix-turn-helix transcriptional regulator n=1 Tax=Pedobacter kyungheensis TaxID=1069985 RepID=UPI00068A73E7|nr:helix-turn-helix transcriptional regulator [Pedobacter kyungheensis]
MTTHLKQGEILERLVRRDRMGISELSRKLKVSRRTIYNWFAQERIDQEIIWQVGRLLGQDLSIDFPDAFPVPLSGQLKGQAIDQVKPDHSNANAVHFWMNKYISLLEKYNDLLSAKDQADHVELRKRLLFGNERTMI